MEKSCLFCGIVFNSVGAQKNCSNECSIKSRRKKDNARKKVFYVAKAIEKGNADRVCVYCGAVYLYKNGFTKYCTEKCRTRSNHSLNCYAPSKHSHLVGDNNKIEFIKVYERDLKKCCQCGIDTPKEKRGFISDDSPEIDHIIPIIRGGHQDYYNVQLLCRKCNIKKSSYITEETMKKAESMWPVAIEIKKIPRKKIGATGYAGVTFCKASNKYKSKISVDGKTINLGSYANPVQANDAFINAEIKYRGDIYRER